MKRKMLICALALAALLLCGCAQQQNQLGYIGAEEAKRLALEAGGFSAAETEFTSVDLSSRSGLDYYEVEFTAAGQRCRYAIDALTGAVIESQVLQPEDGGASSQTGTDAAGSSGNLLTAEEAKAKALAHAGLSSEQVTFEKAKLDYEDGRQVYEVEFYTGDGREYEYEIDASSGAVVRFDYDVKGSSISSGSAITEAQAKELALAQVPGATAADIREFKTDYDDGRTEYEGKIVYGGMAYEFEIDGYSGAFRHWEAEPVKG